nr:DEAD/DEAH box helicase family protein [uncultured Oscillibacter sp.]
MNQNAVIENRDYHLLAIVPSLTGQGHFVLCEDSDGNKFVCPKALWLRRAPQPETSAPVHAGSTSREKINFFLSLFRGRNDLYAKRYYNLKTGKSGYVPACRNEWLPGICDKKTNRCPECPNRAFKPLSAQTVRAHLMGKDEFCRDVVGIYPMLEDDRTWLLAVDFDEDTWREDVSAFRETCISCGVMPAVERSRSGNGAHVWFFFSEPVAAADARKFGSGLLTQAMARRHELRFQSYDRLFPSQDTVPKGGFGNLIALPFQGRAQREGNTLFVDEQFVPYTDQWAFLSTLHKITPEELTKYLTQLCADGDMGVMLESTEQKPWPSKRRTKELVREDFPAQARLMISNLLYVDKTGFSQRALNAVKRLAAFKNPEFYKKQAMRFPVYNTPLVFDCSYEDSDFLGIPRGCMDALTDLLKAYGIPDSLEDQRQAGRTIDVSFNGTLRPEQVPAADALLEHDIGVLSATTAFGKTVVGAYLIGKRRINTLILVHSSALLEQWKASLEQFLDIREPLPEQPKRRGRKKRSEHIGQIGAGKHTRSGIIDIAIMQSLFEGDEKDVKPFVAEYGMVLCDECHHVAAFTFEKILREVKARYVYGLSATPVRQDGHQPIIFMQCGSVRYLVDAKSQAEKRAFSHYVIPRFTRARLPAARKIQDIYAGIIGNEARTNQIISDAVRLIAEGRTPLLLTEQKEHAMRLAEELHGKAEHIFLLLGSGKQKEKREKLTALRAVPTGESLAVVATGKYIGEGFDEPRLDTILLTMPISWKGTLAQYAGRLH